MAVFNKTQYFFKIVCFSFVVKILLAFILDVNERRLKDSIKLAFELRPEICVDVSDVNIFGEVITQREHELSLEELVVLFALPVLRVAHVN